MTHTEIQRRFAALLASETTHIQSREHKTGQYSTTEELKHLRRKQKELTTLAIGAKLMGDDWWLVKILKQKEEIKYLQKVLLAVAVKEATTKLIKTKLIGQEKTQ